MTYRFAIAALLVTSLIWGAAPRAHAQAPAMQKAFEEVKTKLDDLVSAKDENLADDLALRIQVFKKVVEFSVEEAKTLKVKLLSTELAGVDKDALAEWKKRTEKGLADAGRYYQDTLETLATTTTPLDLQNIKALAASFKEWRDASFIPLADEVEKFLLASGQARALEVTSSRFAKIENDIRKLERAKIKGVDKLSALLAKARAHLETAFAAYRNAESLFAKIIAPPVIVVNKKPAAISPTTIVGTSTDPAATSSEALAEGKDEEPPPTLRDEIQASLDAVKQTYRTFLEMSAEVKKILK